MLSSGILEFDKWSNRSFFRDFNRSLGNAKELIVLPESDVVLIKVYTCADHILFMPLLAVGSPFEIIEFFTKETIVGGIPIAIDS